MEKLKKHHIWLLCAGLTVVASLAGCGSPEEPLPPAVSEETAAKASQPPASGNQDPRTSR